MTRQKLLKIMITVFFPLSVHFAVYFGFISGYTTNVFSIATFKEQYLNDIYKYRPLSTYSVIFLAEQLNKIDFKNNYQKFSRQLSFLDEKGEPGFYIAIFLWNGLFLILSVFLVFKLIYYLTDSFNFAALISVLSSLIISITHYVVVPYDNLSYFLLLLSSLLTFKFFKENNKIDGILLIPIIIISTLNRESSALQLSFYGALFLSNYFSDKNNLNPEPKYFTKSFMGLFKGSKFRILIYQLFGFILTYISLRIIFGASDFVIIGPTFWGNLLSPYSIFGYMFFISAAFSIFIMTDRSFRIIHVYYLLLAFPYLISILFNGIIFEYRLFVPIILQMILLAVSCRYLLNPKR